MVSHGFVLPTRGVVLSADDSLEQAARVQSEVIGLARRAEALGFDGVWAGDSVLAKPRLEPLSTLAAVGGRDGVGHSRDGGLPAPTPQSGPRRPPDGDGRSGQRRPPRARRRCRRRRGVETEHDQLDVPYERRGRCSTRGSRSSRDSGTTSPSPSTASSSN